MNKENSVKKRRVTAMLFCCIFMFSFSISSCIYSTLAPSIINHFGITLTQSSWISVTSSIGNLLINVMLIKFGDSFDKSKLLAVLSVLLGLSLLVIGYAPIMGVYLAANVINGMVSWWIDNLTTAYVSDMYGDMRGRYIGILYTLFAVGSALAPSFNTLVLEVLGGKWYNSYRYLGFFISAAALIYILATVAVGKPDVEAENVADENADKEKKEKKTPVLDMLKNRNMRALMISGITMSFYSYFSSTLATYFTFTEPEKYTTVIINVIATASSVGAMVSRFLYVPLAPKLKPIKYLRFQSLFCTTISLACLLIDRPVVWIVMLVLSGLVSGCSYTMTIVLTCNEYPESSSSANAATSFASSIAYMLATPIINYVAEKINFFVAMLIPIAFGFATFFIYKFMYKENVKAQPEQA